MVNVYGAPGATSSDASSEKPSSVAVTLIVVMVSSAEHLNATVGSTSTNG